MSIYTLCGEAARMLLDDPELRPLTRFSNVFTEEDVIALAAKRAGHWEDDDFKEAFKQASASVAALWRGQNACRYGPVDLPGLELPDYMRIGAKIAYGNPDGPELLQTPNGTFRRLMIFNDPLADRQGRRLGTKRDDTSPWEEQEALQLVLRKAAIPATAAEREITRLRDELAALMARAEKAEAENHRLRKHGASMSREDWREEIRREARREVSVELEALRAELQAVITSR